MALLNLNSNTVNTTVFSGSRTYPSIFSGTRVPVDNNFLWIFQIDLQGLSPGKFGATFLSGFFLSIAPAVILAGAAMSDPNIINSLYYIVHCFTCIVLTYRYTIHSNSTLPINSTNTDPEFFGIIRFGKSTTGNFVFGFRKIELLHELYARTSRCIALLYCSISM